jgi:Uma2 family endonuclease
MNVIAKPPLMTTEELLALPENGMDRWLIRGQLREKPMTVRNRWHSKLVARIAQLLGNWLDSQPQPRGEVLGGEAGCRIRRDPDTTVGIDLVYISAALAAHEPTDTTLVDGVPILAVEVLSPSDRVEEIDDKVDEYLQAGVAVVWIVDTHDQSVTVYRPGNAPMMFNSTQELTGDPHLPGFRIPVAQIFQR